MSIYDEKPWLAGYPAGRPRAITPEFGDALSMFAATVARTPDTDAIRYFDGRIGFAELDALTDAFAVGLLDAGVAAGDRLALYLQNVPQFVIALLGTWKAGAVAVSVSPMNREKELGLLLRDSGARALVCLRGLHEDVAVHALGDTDVRLVVTTSEREHQTRGDGRVLAGGERRTPCGTVDLAGRTPTATSRSTPRPTANGRGSGPTT
jgi:long-chain acyl-CoA synthetase